MSLRKSCFSEWSVDTVIWLPPARLEPRRLHRHDAADQSRHRALAGSRHSNAYRLGDGLTVHRQTITHHPPKPIGK
jgi:hypothetical protein